MLRGADIMANVGDIIEVDEKIGNGLVSAGAAELLQLPAIEELANALSGAAEEVFIVKEVETKQEQEITETIELIKEEKKPEIDIKENKKRGR